MSKKRIIGILDGKELDESSEDSLELSDITDDGEAVIKNESQTSEKSNRKKSIKDIRASKSSKKDRTKASSSDTEEEEPPSKKKRPKKKTEDVISKEDDLKKNKNQGSKRTVNKETEAASKTTVAKVDLGLEAPAEKKEGKNLLEILELEMRARAIRSLLEREEKKNKNTGGNQEPSTSGNKKSVIEEIVEDNDPDAVIIIDEGVAAQIDLTLDDSDAENATETKRKTKNLCKNPVTAIEIDEDYLDDQMVAGKKASPPQQRNWTERWLESNEVMKVVKTSKVLTNFKKRLLSKQKNLEEKGCEDVEKESAVIEGTVDEYSLLRSKQDGCDKDIGDGDKEDPLGKTSVDDISAVPAAEPSSSDKLSEPDESLKLTGDANTMVENSSSTADSVLFEKSELINSSDQNTTVIKQSNSDDEQSKQNFFDKDLDACEEKKESSDEKNTLNDQGSEKISEDVELK